MIITATIIIYSLAQGIHCVRREGMSVGGGVASQTVPQLTRLLAVHRVSGGTSHHPGQTSCDLPLETSLSLESPGKEDQAWGSSGGGGVGNWPQAHVSSILVPQPELPCQVETAFTACGCRMWFWNFPTPPAIGCPAPHTLPQAQIGYVGRLSSYPLHPREEWGVVELGGCHLATCVVLA